VTFYEILVIIALILWILISAGLLVALFVVTPRLNSALTEFERISDAMTNRSIPVMEHLDEVLDQLGRVTTTLADDAEIVDRTVVRAAESMERMLELAEDRVSEVNALVSVAVEEAEETFLSTAGLLRVLRLGRGRKKRRGRLLGGERRRKFG
jgi:hypothetical protein